VLILKRGVVTGSPLSRPWLPTDGDTQTRRSLASRFNSDSHTLSRRKSCSRNSALNAVAANDDDDQRYFEQRRPPALVQTLDCNQHTTLPPRLPTNERPGYTHSSHPVFNLRKSCAASKR
jgi:hypothetical protein